MALVLLVFESVFLFLPNFVFTKWELFPISILYIINNGINPFIYMFFNKFTCKKILITQLTIEVVTKCMVII